MQGEAAFYRQWLAEARQRQLKVDGVDGVAGAGLGVGINQFAAADTDVAQFEIGQRDGPARLGLSCLGLRRLGGRLGWRSRAGGRRELPVGMALGIDFQVDHRMVKDEAVHLQVA